MDLLNKTEISQLIFSKYLEAGNLVSYFGQEIVHIDNLKKYSDEQWLSKSEEVLTFDFDGWSANVTFTKNGSYHSDSLDFFFSTNDANKYTIGLYEDLQRFILSSGINVNQFVSDNELVILFKNAASAHYLLQNDRCVLRKLSGAFLDYAQTYAYYKKIYGESTSIF